MQSQASPQDNSIGSLIRQNPECLPQGIAKKPAKKAYRYPYLDKEAITATIQNAKRWAEDFNKAQQEKSAGINKINHELRLELKQIPHTTEQKILFQEFKQEHKLASLEPMAYNQKVVQFNREHGTRFLMRSYRRLKNEVDVTLPILVFFYAAQIRANNARKLNAGVTTTGTLPRMLTNSESIRRYKVEGVPQLRYQNDAILSHVHHLVEAGVLINYRSHGRNMGFSVDFNPEILAVKDHIPGKSQKPVNQKPIKFKTGKSTYSDCITRTCKDNNENKGDAYGLPDERNGATAPTLATGNNHKVTKSEETPGGKANFEAGKPVKNQRCGAKKQEQSKPAAAATSAKLEQSILETWDLCLQLSEDQHVHHIPPMKELVWEARNGTMSQPQFRELIFQEFMKYISRLKRGNQSGAGAFYRAFEELDDKKLINFSGRYFEKTTMLQEFQKWMWMVDHAERWAKKHDWNLLYINDYLDTQRRDGKEVGFWYLEKQWKANEKKKADRKKKRLEKVQQHQIRKKKIKQQRVDNFGYRSVKPGTNSKSLSDYEKARKAVRKYLYGQMPFEELHRYCRHNLNQSIVDGLGNLIDAETENLRKFKA